MNNLISQARELCEKATQGPWEYSPAGHIYRKETGFIDTVAFVGQCGKQAVRDCAFIAASRTLLPALADELELSQKEIERLEADMEELGRYRAAEKDGRCVVLPCKVGDTVDTRYGKGEVVAWDATARVKIIDEKDFMKRYRDFDIGSKIFTRAEADSALGKGGEK